MKNKHYSEVEIDDLKIIQKRYRIDDARFVQGLDFAEMVADGMAANDAYARAFQCSNSEASMYSANLKRTKWVQDLIKYLLPDPTVDFTEVRRTIISKNMKTIRSSSEPTEIAAATNALAKFVITPPSKEEAVQDSSAAEMIVGKLIDKMSELAAENKMVSPSGDIVEIGVLE